MDVPGKPGIGQCAALPGTETILMEENNTSLQPSVTEELKQLLADVQRYRNEAQRYRNEARSALAAARDEHADIVRERLEKSWAVASLPPFPAPYRTDDVGDGAFLLTRAGADEADFSAYGAALSAAGFSRHAEFAEGAVRAATYYNDSTVVSLSFATSDGILRAVSEPMAKTALPAITPVPCGDLPILFRQEGDLFEKVDCGMSYIFRLADGKFFVIDGGWNTPGIADRLFAALSRMAEGKTPVIAAWIFTHAHIDHIGAFFDFARDYAEKVKLETVIYSFPGKSRLTEMGDTFVAGFLANWDECVARFEGARVIKARTGQRFYLSGLTVELLFTFEDYPMPHRLHNFNDTSLVFRVRAAGQKWMFLGDIAESGAPLFCARYGNGLESDVVQVAHHGYPGGTDELYDCIKAPVVLWPAPLVAPWGPLRYADPEWSAVTRRMVQKYAKKVFVAGEGAFECTLPLQAD